MQRKSFRVVREGFKHPRVNMNDYEKFHYLLLSDVRDRREYNLLYRELIRSVCTLYTHIFIDKNY